MGRKKAKIFIVCTGVGHIHRGYESFTQECFNALSDRGDQEYFLLKGGGEPRDHELRITCLQRNSSAAAFISRITGKETYQLEQLSFLVGMIPALIRHQPAVIFYSDFILGTYLWHLRRVMKFKYRLLFSNGAPNGPPFSTMDHVQQLMPFYLDEAVKNGAPAAMQTLLPYGFDIRLDDRLDSLAAKATIKAALGLPTGKKIILSVGAINKHHKRMHYLISELAQLPEEYFLVILGQFEDETPELQVLADTLLRDRYVMKSVPYERVRNYYLASDAFVLTSLSEGFGRVLIEAASYGCRSFVHDSITFRQVMGEDAVYVDMNQPGALAGELLQDTETEGAEQRINAVYERYSWDRLAPNYSAMITKLIQSNA